MNSCKVNKKWVMSKLISDKPLVMGIVNITDDSFFEESRVMNKDLLLSKVKSMIDHKVDIIDLGASSSRPGANPVSEVEEIKRVTWAVEILKKDFPNLNISIDTFRCSVAKAAFSIDKEIIINDISAGEDDPKMLLFIAKNNLEYIAMHKRGSSINMSSLNHYSNIVEDIHDYFIDFINRAIALGIDSFAIDPGFGFAKDLKQNYHLLKNLKSLRLYNSWQKIPILVGISRKSMIYKLLNMAPSDSLSATTALNLYALQMGADILRVHDVKEAQEAIKIYMELK